LVLTRYVLEVDGDDLASRRQAGDQLAELEVDVELPAMQQRDAALRPTPVKYVRILRWR
jgi:hypothetical protein